MGIFDSDKGPPRPRFFDDDYRRREVNRKSRQQEQRLAKALGGSRVAGSGSTRTAPFARKGVHLGNGDVKLDDFLMEAKRTDSNVMTLRSDWLHKIRKQAAANMKFPALALEFGDSGPNVEEDWIVLPRSIFNRMLRGCDE